MSRGEKIGIFIVVALIVIIIVTILILMISGDKIIAIRRSGGYFDSREELKITYKSDEIDKIEWILEIDDKDDIYDLEEDLLDGGELDENDIEIKQHGDDNVEVTVTGDSIEEFVSGGWIAYIDLDTGNDIDDVTDILEDEGWRIND